MSDRYLIFSAQYPPHLGGIERFTESLAAALAAEGDEVCVVTNNLDNSASFEILNTGVEIVRLPCYPFIDGRLPVPKRHSGEFRRTVESICSKPAAGILINARFYPHTLIGLGIAERLGICPLVLDHGSAWLSFSDPLLDPFVRLWERSFTRLVKRKQPLFYGISAKSVQWLSHFGIEAKGVLSNAIDAKEFRELSSGRDFRHELGIDETEALLVFTGRLIPEKGTAVFAELAGGFQRSVRKVMFALAGDGPDKKMLEHTGCSNLRLLGSLSRPDISALLQQADLFVLPSRSEGFASCLLEAAAAGLPFISTDVGGARELAPDSTYGCIVEEMSADSFEPAINEMLSDKDSLKRMGGRLQDRSEQLFSWEKTASDFRNACTAGKLKYYNT